MLIRHIYGFAVFGQNKPSVLGGQQQSFGQWSDERIVLRLHENLVHEQRVVRSDIRFFGHGTFAADLLYAIDKDGRAGKYLVDFPSHPIGNTECADSSAYRQRTCFVGLGAQLMRYPVLVAETLRIHEE